MSLSSHSEDNGFGGENGNLYIQADDIQRHIENRLRYGYLYDPFDDESPAAMSQRFSAELISRLKGEQK